jgi:hypothetical protein
MKKVARASIILAVLVFVGVIMSSCKSTQQCPSFGEVKKYQKEVRR